ncbi:MAG: TIGR01459 family HAD-type hydrolase [Pseudomonadota bacterium]
MSDVSNLPLALNGLSQIADEYDAIFCDVWGVLHNGQGAFDEACEALKRFRETRGPVVLITNAPVPAERVTAMFPKVGVPEECYDVVVASGDATRAELQRHAPGPVYRIGPDYDDPLYHGLDLDFSQDSDAQIICCTGLRDMPDDEPERYRKELAELAERGLEMICANPDVVFRYGDQLIWSAGALANIFAEYGGRIIRPGKPDAPIYDLAFEKLDLFLPETPSRERVLAIGDGPSTDVLGAMKQGLDCVFIGGGIHGEAMASGDAFLMSAAELLTREETSAAYATPALAW